MTAPTLIDPGPAQDAGLSPLHPAHLLTLHDLTAQESDFIDADGLSAEADPTWAYPDDPAELVLPAPLRRSWAAAPGIVSVIAAHGFPTPDLWIGLCAAAGIELAAGLTMFEKETGGRNVYGHDPVDTGGCYTTGGPVTQPNYACFRGSHTAGWNGVGPPQITWRGYIEKADARGGGWRPEVSSAVGLETLSAGIRASGLRTAFRAYNGSGPAAEAYADDAMVRLARWRAALAGAAPAPAPSGGGLPVLHEGDASHLIWEVQVFLDQHFGAYSHIDAGPGPDSRLGPQTVQALTEFQRREGIPTAPPFAVGPNTWAALCKEGFRP